MSQKQDGASYPRMPKVASSGDLVLDRRREWAVAATADGFHQAAAEIYEQILERAPYWALAWLELGDSRLKLGERDAAITAYRAAASRDGQGVLAADLKLAALGAAETPPAPPANYVAGLFDQYADNFDEHLVGALEYRGPAILRDVITRACAQAGRDCGFSLALDIGCGTGLMGVKIKDLCETIDGVDLSRKMIKAARKTGVYRALDAGDVTDWLLRQPRGRAKLVIAADVFVYLGDLAPVFAASARALAQRGVFAFTVQQGGPADYAVGDDMRYAHSAGYLHRLAGQHGLEMTVLEEVSTRKDRGIPVPGLAAAMFKL